MFTIASRVPHCASFVFIAMLLGSWPARAQTPGELPGEQTPPPISIHRANGTVMPSAGPNLPPAGSDSGSTPPDSRVPPPTSAAAGAWVKLTNVAPGGIGTRLLLTDGNVIVQQGSSEH